MAACSILPLDSQGGRVDSRGGEWTAGGVSGQLGGRVDSEGLWRLWRFRGPSSLWVLALVPLPSLCPGDFVVNTSIGSEWMHANQRVFIFLSS